MSASVVHCATCGATNPPDAAACMVCSNPPLMADPQAASPAAIVSSSSQTSDAPGPAILPLKGAAAHPGTSSQGKIVILSPLWWSLPVKKKIGIASIGGVIALSLVAILIARSPSFHQTVVTSQAVPYIQVGLGGTIAPNTSGSDTFHVEDIVYVTFVLRDTSLPGVSVRLFMGTMLKQTEMVSTGENVDQLFVEVISTPKGTVTGIQLTEETTVTQTGTYKWEVDDNQRNVEASITFQVTGKE